MRTEYNKKVTIRQKMGNFTEFNEVFMKKIMFLSAVMGSLISVNAFAHNIQPNQLLANVTVSDKGEITFKWQ